MTELGAWAAFKKYRSMTQYNNLDRIEGISIRYAIVPKADR